MVFMLGLLALCCDVSSATAVGLYVKNVPLLASNDASFVSSSAWYSSTNQLTGISYEPVDTVNFSATYSAFPYYQRMAVLTGGQTNWTNGPQFRVGGQSCNSVSSAITGSWWTALISTMAMGAKNLNASYVVCLNPFWTPAVMTQAAVALYSALGPHLQALELGNEMDGVGWTYNQYLNTTTMFRNAILAAVPSVKFQSFASGWNTWPNYFVNSGNISSYDKHMVSVSLHVYPASTAIDNLMRYMWSTGYVGEAAIAHKYGARWVFGEANIREWYQQWAATIYVLDNICTAAVSHSDGINWSGAYGGYSPLARCGGPVCANGHYYAFWAYASLMGPGGYLSLISSQSLSKYLPAVRIFQAWRAGRTIGLILINKQSVSASVNFTQTGAASLFPTLCSGCAYIKWLLPPVSTVLPASQSYLANATAGITWGNQTLSNVNGSLLGKEVRVPFTSVHQAIVMQPYTVAIVFFTS